MKATLEGHVIAASDDVVDCDGYVYFPHATVRVDVLEKASKDRRRLRVSARRAVLRRGGRRQATRAGCVDLRGAASYYAGGREPFRILGRCDGRKIATAGLGAGFLATRSATEPTQDRVAFTASSTTFAVSTNCTNEAILPSLNVMKSPISVSILSPVGWKVAFSL